MTTTSHLQARGRRVISWRAMTGWPVAVALLVLAAPAGSAAATTSTLAAHLGSRSDLRSNPIQGLGSVQGMLLPVPAAAAGQFLRTDAVDVNPLGVVVGNTDTVTTNPDGSQSESTTAQRWAYLPGFGWLRQQLAMPAGATDDSVVALANGGESGGSITTGGVLRAVRWSVTGRSSSFLGGAGSTVDAVGPNGPWGVTTNNPENPIGASSELVFRGGRRIALTGTPELDAGYRTAVASIGGPHAALVGVRAGVGRGTNAHGVIWQDGATLTLPVSAQILEFNFCASQIQPDGSLVYSGLANINNALRYVLVRHSGGVPGRDVELARAASYGPAFGQPGAGLGCEVALSSDKLAGDGGVAGNVIDSAGVSRAAYWNANNVRTVIALGPGETSAVGAVVATGGRVVVQAQDASGVTRFSLWHNGIRTALSIPSGWTVDHVVEFTDRGLFVATVTDEAGSTRPIAWDLAGR
jgi:hypothetical protein